MGIIVLILFLFVFLIIIVTGAEYAYLSSNRLTIELRRKQGKNSGKILVGFFDNPEKFWQGTLIAFYLLLVGVCYLSMMGVEKFLSGKYLSYLPEDIATAIIEYDYIRTIITFFISALLILVPIGLISKQAFESHPEAKLNTWANFIHFLSLVLRPIAIFFTSVSEFMLKYLFNINIENRNGIFERVNTKQFVRQSIEGQVDGEQKHKALFKKALQLSQIKLRKCMTPRNECTAVEIDTSVEDLRDLFNSTKLSKIVVYQNNLDNVLGYTHHLDLNKKPEKVKDILHTIITVPETMTGLDLLHTFSKERKSIAWVIDEFGGTAGFITMEDVLEQIFGDISDEYDTDEYIDKQLSATEYMFTGRIGITYLNDKYKFNIQSKTSQTLSGFIINHHGAIPEKESRIIINNFEFEILLVSATRIETVKMKLLHK